MKNINHYKFKNDVKNITNFIINKLEKEID